MEIKRKKLPKFLKNSDILDSLEDENGNVIIAIKNYKNNTEINNIQDYIDLLDTVSYFGVEIPKEIKKFEENKENEDEILQVLIERKDTNFYKQQLENFKFLISNRSNSAIILYNISGTDPTKETQIEIFFSKKDKKDVNKKIKDIIINIYKGFIEDSEESEGQEDLLMYYNKILKTLKKTEKIDLKKLSYEPIFPGADHSQNGHNFSYNLKEGLYLDFVEPEDSYLVALDYHSSFDRHYYINVIKKITDNIELSVHSH